MLLRDEAIDGEVRLLFQPSEENQDSEDKSGATRMIEDNAIAGLDAVIALHVDPGLASGKISIREGHILANSDEVFARVIGRGGHGASPHLARDPVFMLAPVLTAIHGIVSRWVKPTEPAVITVGRLAGGTVSNVIPGHVALDLTVRSISDEVRAQLLVEIEQALAITRALGGDYELRIRHGYPALYNNPDVAGWIRETAVTLLGADNVVDGQLVMGGEDFAYMTRASRGAMLRLGTWRAGDKRRFLHHPEFDLDENALPIGAAVLAQTALRFFRGEVG
jgi:amidohydrolase